MIITRLRSGAMMLKAKAESRCSRDKQEVRYTRVTKEDDNRSKLLVQIVGPGMLCPVCAFRQVQVDEGLVITAVEPIGLKNRACMYL